jgi:hypothetical protein
MKLDIKSAVEHDVKVALLNDKDTTLMSAEAWAARMIRTTLGLAAWTAAWVATLALAAMGPAALWNHASLPTLLAVAFNLLVGIGMLFANRRHLRELDELQRTIQLNAMALTLGAGLVGGMTWTLLDRYRLIGFEASVGHLVILMAAVYIVGCFVGLRRYR